MKREEWYVVCGTCQCDRWRSMMHSADIGDMVQEEDYSHSEWKRRLYGQLKHRAIRRGHDPETVDAVEFELRRELYDEELTH